MVVGNDRAHELLFFSPSCYNHPPALNCFFSSVHFSLFYFGLLLYKTTRRSFD